MAMADPKYIIDHLCNWQSHSQSLFFVWLLMQNTIKTKVAYTSWHIFACIFFFLFVYKKKQWLQDIYGRIIAYYCVLWQGF